MKTTYSEGGDPFTKKWFLGDAKFSTKDKNWIVAWLEASTSSQKIVYPKFQNGEVIEFYIRATKPEKISQIKATFGIDDLSKPIKINDLESLKIFGSEANQLLIKGDPIELLK